MNLVLCGESNFTKVFVHIKVAVHVERTFSKIAPQYVHVKYACRQNGTYMGRSVT